MEITVMHNKYNILSSISDHKRNFVEFSKTASTVILSLILEREILMLS